MGFDSSKVYILSLFILRYRYDFLCVDIAFKEGFQLKEPVGY